MIAPDEVPREPPHGSTAVPRPEDLAAGTGIDMGLAGLIPRPRASPESSNEPGRTLSAAVKHPRGPEPKHCGPPGRADPAGEDPAAATGAGSASPPSQRSIDPPARDTAVHTGSASHRPDSPAGGGCTGGESTLRLVADELASTADSVASTGDDRTASARSGQPGTARARCGTAPAGQEELSVRARLVIVDGTAAAAWRMRQAAAIRAVLEWIDHRSEGGCQDAATKRVQGRAA
jgi:hypothetical protein